MALNSGTFLASRLEKPSMTQSNLHRTWRKLSVHIAARALVIAALMTVRGWVSTASAADWPQWQGRDRNAISTEQGLLQEWPVGGPPHSRKIRGLRGGEPNASITPGKKWVVFSGKFIGDQRARPAYAVSTEKVK
jgi:hypothetical protein